MKTFFIVISVLIGSLFYSTNTAISKNDTVIILNRNNAIKFDAYFSSELCNNAKSDISKIMSDDPDNYKFIFAGIKSLIVHYDTCNVHAIIPILKHYGSLRHILNYKKMFHIYFRERYSLKTWAKSVYYIIDDKGYFVYVELKDVFPGQHLVFTQDLLKSVKVHKNMLNISGL
jgi:hypothetical protein